LHQLIAVRGYPITVFTTPPAHLGDYTKRLRIVQAELAGQLCPKWCETLLNAVTEETNSNLHSIRFRNFLLKIFEKFSSVKIKFGKFDTVCYINEVNSNKK